MENEVGRAYLFFYSGASKQEIEEQFPFVRKAAGNPSEMELILNEIDSAVFDDEDLKILSEFAKEERGNYVISARLENQTNLGVARELGIFQNCLYNSSLQDKFRTPEGKFSGDLVYKNDCEYEVLD